MPSLMHVDPNQLDYVWPLVAPLLEKAVAKNVGEATIDQVRMQVVYRSVHLLAAYEGEVPTGAAIIEFRNHPNQRVANISYISGITSQEQFNWLKSWCAAMGASAIEGCGSEAVARLWRRYGFEKTYTTVRLPL